MITLLILLILFIGAYSGYKNGILIQLIRTIGYLVTMSIAFNYYLPLSEFLFLMIPYPSPFAPESNPYYFYDKQFMFSLEYTYYRLVAFILILLAGWLVVRLVSQFFVYIIEEFNAPEPVNGTGGGILGFTIHYVGIFYLLFLASLIPMPMVQENLSESFAANAILTASPVLTENSHERFVLEAYGEHEANQPTMIIEPAIEVPVEGSTEESTENNEE